MNSISSNRKSEKTLVGLEVEAHTHESCRPTDGAGVISNGQFYELHKSDWEGE